MSSPSLSVEELKQRACETIERNKKEIVGVAQQILANPEGLTVEIDGAHSHSGSIEGIDS